MAEPSLASVVPPVLLPGQARSAWTGADGPLRRAPLPMPALPQQRTEAKMYRLASVDSSGRIRDRSIIGAMGWEPGARLDIRQGGGVIVVRRDPQGVFTVTGQGHLLLPAAVRHWCGLAAGERVLLTADPAAKLLVVYPPIALDQMVAQAERAVLGGDPA